MYRHVPNLITILRLVLTVAFFFILNNNDTSNFKRQMYLWSFHLLFFQPLHRFRRPLEIVS